MSTYGKCPKCEAVIIRVGVAAIDADPGPSRVSWHGLAYTCPHCQTILSVGIDPIALKADTVSETVAEIAKLLGRRA